jgi:hypothetical protein
MFSSVTTNRPEYMRKWRASRLASQTPEERELEREQRREYDRNWRAARTPEQRERALARKREYNRKRWATPELQERAAQPEQRARRRAIQQKYRQANPIALMLSTVKRHAKKLGREFTLRQSDIVFPPGMICPCCGKQMSHGYGRGSGYHADIASIHRIDNSGGYVPANIWIICWGCNTIKATRTIGNLSGIPVIYVPVRVRKAMTPEQRERRRKRERASKRVEAKHEYERERRQRPDVKAHNREYHRKRRASMTPEQREQQRERDRRWLASRTPEQIERKREHRRERAKRARMRVD